MHSRKSMAASAPTYVSNSSGPSTGTSSATGGAVGVGSGGGGGGGYRHTAGASVIGQSAQDYDGLTFFEREKLRLTEEIAANFENLLGSANTLNRKLEEVFGVGKEFQTVADLWGKFDHLIREQKPEDSLHGETNASHLGTHRDGLRHSSIGVPGTGGRHFGNQEGAT